ncbi:MAG: polysaccharide biosynthesis tyrosine autokinase [Bacteroidaceae bacterium]|nr:polysaccharide biosynthesis tyrosine autokinase [Bacteroidaceae bacterium]
MIEANTKPRSKQKNTSDEDFNLYEILFRYLAYWPCFIVSVAICICCALVYLRYSTPVYSTSAKILIKEQDNYRGKSSTPLSDVMELATINLTSLFDNELEILKSKTLIKKAVCDLGLYITHSQRRTLGYDPQFYNNAPVQVYMSPEDANKLPGRIGLRMLYDGKKLTVHGSFPNKKKEPVMLDSTFTEFPVLLSTDVGIITLTPDRNYMPTEPIELLAYISNPQSTAASYSASMSISPTSKTTTIAKITVNNTVPARGADFICQLVKVYNEDANNEKNEVALKTAEFIEERISLINSELSNTEDELATFKQRSGLTNLTNDAQIALQEKHRYEQQFTENATQLNLVQDLQNYLLDADKVNEVIPSNIGLEDANLKNVINQYNTLLLERKRLLRTSTENNPAVVNINFQIEEMRSNVQTSISSVLRGLQIAKNNLQREINRLVDRISDAPKQEQEFMTIQRQQEIKATLYTLLLKKREENALTLAATASNGRIIEAPASGGPIAPRSKMLLVTAIIIGLGLPIGIIFLTGLLKYKIENRGDIEKLTKVPVVGEIPSCTQKLKGHTNSIVIQENRNNIMEEAFRAIRTNLLFMLEKGQKVILVTSSIPQEGKSFVAANLAVSLAFLGHKTLIVGMDIRKPGLNKTFGFSTRSHGITNYLSNPEGVNLSEMIMCSEISPNLHILPGGSVPPNPTELVARPIFDTTIEQLKQQYDYIILDTAPIGLVTDTSIIAHVADLGVIISRADYTPKAAFRNINNLQQDKIFTKLATLINDIDMNQRKNSYSYCYGRKYGYGYGRKYGYGYGYGYGYEEENSKEGKA